MSTKLQEAVQANNLHDVVGLIKMGEDVNQRGTDGKTVLQSLLNENISADVLKALLDKVDLVTRDCSGQTVAEQIFCGNFSPEVEGAFVTFVKGVILNEKVEKLEKMLMSGWTFWPVSKEQAKNVSPELEEFISKAPDILSKVACLHKAIVEDDVKEVQNCLERKKLILASDRTGLPPFHKAVLFGSTDAIDWMLSEFKYAVEHKDHMGRTVLHYAAALPDAGYVYSTLVDAGAKEDVTDVTGKTPQDYYSNALLLNIMNIRQQVEDLLQSPIPEPRHGYGTSGLGQTYISGHSQARVPPPTTIDGKYVATHLGTALTLALAEIAEKRPWDPIEFLGQWLYKYRDTMDYIEEQQRALSKLKSEAQERQKEEDAKKVIQDEQRAIQEAERIQREKEEEEQRRKEQEELQRKAREADLLAQRPNLDTVTEEGEDEVTGKDKDGQTELHKLAAQEGSDLTALLNLGYNLAERDCNFKTPRDIASEKGIQENVDAIDNYLKGQIEKEKFEVLNRLLLDGYDQLKSAIDKLATEGLSEEVRKFVESVPKTQEKCKSILAQVDKSSLEELKECLEGVDPGLVRDRQSRGLLHLAVLQQKPDIVEYLASNHPHSLKCKDSLNRTPLHYAMGLGSEEIITMLTSKGADETAKDAKQRVPSYYKENPAEISEIKESLTSQPKTEVQGQETTEGQGQEQVQEGTEGQTSTEQTEETSPVQARTEEVTSGGDQSTTEQTAS